MIIGRPQRTNRGPYAIRWAVTLVTLAALGLAARAQQPATPNSAPSAAAAAAPSITTGAAHRAALKGAPPPPSAVSPGGATPATAAGIAPSPAVGDGTSHRAQVSGAFPPPPSVAVAPASGAAGSSPVPPIGDGAAHRAQLHGAAPPTPSNTVPPKAEVMPTLAQPHVASQSTQAPGTLLAQLQAPASLRPPVPAASKPEEEETAPSNSRPGHENIKVHGHWKIDVHNPDGTFVKHVEGDNSLVSPNSADVILSEFLAGQFTLSGFEITADTAASAFGGSGAGYGGLCPYFGQYITCYLVPGATLNLATNIQYNWCYFSDGPSSPQYQYCFPGLTQTFVPYNSTTKAAAYFQIQGSFTPYIAGSIAYVSTIINGCSSTSYSTISSTTCNLAANVSSFPAGTTTQSAYFTRYQLPTPLVVQGGQIVTITVTLSFS